MGALKVCTGCGAPVQSESPQLPGYVPAAVIDRDEVVCRRCFRIRNYGEFSRFEIPFEQYEEEVTTALRDPGLVLYVLDVFDLAGSLVRGFSKLARSQTVWVVVNKVDLLPPEVDFEKLEPWIRDEVEKTGVSAEKVWFLSTKSQVGVPELRAALKSKNPADIYAVGMANVGKSSLLNVLVGTTSTLTASPVPGTTVGINRIGWTAGDGKMLSVVDTPGLIHGERISDKLCASCLAVAVPSTRIKPKVYQLNPGQTLFLGGFARLDFEQGERQPIVIYVSNQLPVHRTKLERAQDIANSHQDDILKVPCESCRRDIPPFVRYAVGKSRGRGESRFLQTRRGGMDMVIPGLGWISLFSGDFGGALWLEGGITPSTRPRLVGVLSRSTR